MINILCLYQELNLSYYNIDSFHCFAFTGQETLYVLYISRNRLASAPLLTDVESRIQELYLARNYIKHIKDSYLDFCMNIAHVNIGFNELDAFPSMHNIARSIVFGVEGNNISNTGFVYGNSFPRLKNLDLESNQIGDFCPPPEKNCATTAFPELARKQAFNDTLPLWITSSRTAGFLENNPWHCNGSLGWTQHCQVRDDKAASVMLCMEWLVIRDMVCESPLEVQGLSPKEAGNRSRSC